MMLRPDVRRALAAPALAAVAVVGAVACSDDETAEAPEGDSQAMTGQQVFEDNGCAGCHSTSGGSGTGPNLDGIHGEDVELEDGSTVTRDDEYLHRAVEEPTTDIVDGFSSQMPTIGLDDEQIDALVAYIRSLG